MFTAPHLSIFIMNALMPLLWIYLIIRNLTNYFETIRLCDQVDAETDQYISRLPEIKADTPLPTVQHIEAAKVNAELTKARQKSDRKFAKFNIYTWVIIGCFMTISTTMDTIEVAVKLYHRECPCQLRCLDCTSTTTSTTNSVPEVVEAKGE